MLSLRPRTTAFVAAGLLSLALLAYAARSTRSQLEERVNFVEHELVAYREQDAAKVQELAARLDDVNRALDYAQALSASLRSEHTQSAQRLNTQLKSTSAAVDRLRKESASKLEEVQRDATTKIGAVSGDVEKVKIDLNNTKDDLALSRKQIGDIGNRIARNSTELAELRQRGERDYYEFDVRKAKAMERIADVELQLRKTDAKRSKYDVVMLVDDSKVEKKDRVANEPVTFLVGRDRSRYELVVNYVDKDRIRGYLSTPKDKAISAEGPTLRKQP